MKNHNEKTTLDYRKEFASKPENYRLIKDIQNIFTWTQKNPESRLSNFLNYQINEMATNIRAKVDKMKEQDKSNQI